MRIHTAPFKATAQFVRRQQGLSLLEIMIAMAIVFLALLGFAGFSVVAHTGMSVSIYLKTYFVVTRNII